MVGRKVDQFIGLGSSQLASILVFSNPKFIQGKDLFHKLPKI